jgi:hypothetical protein
MKIIEDVNGNKQKKKVSKDLDLGLHANNFTLKSDNSMASSMNGNKKDL